jgi:hypothetical protein
MRWTTLATTVLSFCAFSGSALAQQAKPAWYSGFEEGFPGEWLDWGDGSFTTSGNANSGVYAGEHVYKGWAVSAKNDSHRAYPVIHVDIPSPLVNSFMVYLDVDYSNLSSTDWVHFATWGNNEDWAVHTLSVRERKLEMAHLSWRYIGPGSQPEFPLRRWVRLTAYIHYDGDEGYVRLWQDGVAMLEGTYTAVPGRNLMRAHWGWYSNGAITRGVQYNDEIQIWTLDEPLTNLEREPASPYPPVDNGSGGAASGGSGSGGAAAGGRAAGGRAGSGGAPPRGGAAGSGSAVAGRAGSGGAPPSPTAGSGGQAGFTIGGFTAGGTLSGSSGSSARAGSAPVAGTSPLPEAGSPPVERMDPEAGCTYAAPGSRASSSAWLSGVLLALGSVLTRRARRGRSSPA